MFTGCDLGRKPNVEVIACSVEGTAQWVDSRESAGAKYCTAA